MATKKPATSKSTTVANWDEELARQAEFFSKQEESTQTGAFFTTKGGVLAFNDAPLPNNEMVVIILDAILENIYYEGAYDPDAPAAPVCFAFGRVEDELAPHAVIVEAGTQQCGASGLCQGCEKNEWGSADTGRGKACKNSRRLALVPGGTVARNGEVTFFEEEDHFVTAGIGLLKLPVTSVKGYAAFVKQVTGALKKPPLAVYTRVRVVPDTSTQFKVTFEVLGEVPQALYGVLFKRVDEAKTMIDVPYTPADPDAPPKRQPPPKRGAKAAPPLRSKTPGKKY